jgi:uncharacterized protein YndB with AHSA1/START domain
MDQPVEAQITIDAEPAAVWRVMTEPDLIRRWLSDAEVTIEADWEAGGAMRWVGTWHGRPFKDTGRILEIEPGRLLAYEHHSRMSGNTNTVRWELSGKTVVTVTQAGFKSPEERAHVAFYWRMALAGVARVTSGA